MGKLLVEKEVAELLSCSTGLLRKWRAEGRGPKVVKINRMIRYSPDSVRSFVEAHELDPWAPPATQQATGAGLSPGCAR